MGTYWVWGRLRKDTIVLHYGIESSILEQFQNIVFSSINIQSSAADSTFCYGPLLSRHTVPKKTSLK